MFIHTNHPHHRDGALRIAGASEATKEALAAAVAKWNAADIEEAINKGGCVGGVTRSRDEWNAHPHGKAVARLPLIDIGVNAPASWETIVVDVRLPRLLVAGVVGALITVVIQALLAMVGGEAMVAELIDRLRLFHPDFVRLRFERDARSGTTGPAACCG